MFTRSNCTRVLISLYLGTIEAFHSDQAMLQRLLIKYSDIEPDRETDRKTDREKAKQTEG